MRQRWIAGISAPTGVRVIVKLDVGIIELMSVPDPIQCRKQVGLRGLRREIRTRNCLPAGRGTRLQPGATGSATSVPVARTVQGSGSAHPDSSGAGHDTSAPILLQRWCLSVASQHYLATTHRTVAIPSSDCT